MAEPKPKSDFDFRAKTAVESGSKEREGFKKWLTARWTKGVLVTGVFFLVMWGWWHFLSHMDGENGNKNTPAVQAQVPAVAAELTEIIIAKVSPDSPRTIEVPAGYMLRCLGRVTAKEAPRKEGGKIVTLSSAEPVEVRCERSRQ